MAGFESWLEPLLAGLPPALADRDTRARMLAAAALLPGEIAFQTFGFETPLHAPAARADILVSAVRARGGAAMLMAAPAHPLWEPVTSLGAALGAEPAQIDDVWLEFDLFGPMPDVPNLFCRPLYPPGDLGALRARAAFATAALTGALLPEALLDAVLRCAAALPERAMIFQIGAMRARPSAGLRLCINQISLDAILSVLGALSYPDVAGVRALLIRYQRAVGDVALALDLTPGPGARIGLECYFAPSRTGRSPDELLAMFLSRLVEDRACRPGKAEALRAYPGVAEIEPGTGWPDALLATRSLLGKDFAGRFHRSVHHIKLVHQPGKPLEAKAYLAIRHALSS